MARVCSQRGTRSQVSCALCFLELLMQMWGRQVEIEAEFRSRNGGKVGAGDINWEGGSVLILPNHNIEVTKGVSVDREEI